MKNFLPGPTEVHPEVLAKLCLPIIGHHTLEFQELIKQIKPRLQRLLGTSCPVFTLTCTASAAMEAALTNVGGAKILVVSNGAFGERWLTTARLLGLDADGLVLGWGIPIPEHELERLINRVGYDTLVLVHGESSTGMLNPLEPISDVLSKRTEVLLILDAVATLGGVPLSMDAAGVDVLVGASQKCLALPPGIVPIGVSEGALARSGSSRRKGFAFDFNLWNERWEKYQTVATPAIPQLQALNLQLEWIEKETLEARWERHLRMSQLTTDWAQRHGCQPFAPVGFRLPSVSCLRLDGGRKTAPIVNKLRDLGYLIDDGYGRLKGITLRIGHLGDWKEEDLEGLLSALEKALN
jgi:aspartate aminotransferase-like enzyme